MSVNKAFPYLYVLPEDDANRQLAIGFYLNTGPNRQMLILKVANGWRKLLNLFSTVHVQEMDRDQNRFMALLIDFDGKPDRRAEITGLIPEHLSDRVFVLGSLTNPEKLRQSLRPADLNSYEEIGSALAEDCRDNTDLTWGRDLLRHNADEVDRLRVQVRPILFLGP